MQYKAVQKCNIYYQEECQTRNLATRQKTCKKIYENCMQKWNESECQKHVIRKDVEISKCSLKFFVD